MSDDQINGAAGGSKAAAGVQRTRDSLLCVQVREAVTVCVLYVCVLRCELCAFDETALLITKLMCSCYCSKEAELLVVASV